MSNEVDGGVGRSFWRSMVQGLFCHLLRSRVCVVCRQALYVETEPPGPMLSGSDRWSGAFPRARGGLEQWLCPECQNRLPWRYQSMLLKVNASPGPAYAVWRYQGTAFELIRRLKFEGQLEAAEAMAEAIYAYCPGFFRGFDAFVPIPLSEQSYRMRGFNQSKVLAEALAKRFACPVWTLLERIGSGEKRSKMGRSGRLSSELSYGLDPEFRSGLMGPLASYAGARVLLIDDVATTGRTLVEAAIPLRQIGILTTGFAMASDMASIL